MGEICAQDLERVDIINKWLKTRNPEYKIRVVSKKEFAIIKIQSEKRSNKIILW